MQNFESDYAKWIETISANLRKAYNRDYKTLPYAFELRYFSGCSTKEVMRELQMLFPDLHVKRPGNAMDRVLKY